MDDLFHSALGRLRGSRIHTLSDEQLVAAGEDVKLMSALRSDERVLLSVSWPGWPAVPTMHRLRTANTAPEAFRAGATSTDTELARSIDAMWSQALHLAKQILDGELPLTRGAAEQAPAVAARGPDLPRAVATIRG